MGVVDTGGKGITIANNCISRDGTPSSIGIDFAFVFAEEKHSDFRIGLLLNGLESL